MVESPALAAQEHDVRRSICYEIVEAVAEREGIAADGLAVPLYEAVDPDALERLLAIDTSPRRPAEVQFDYAGYRVTARSDGTVEVE